MTSATGCDVKCKTNEKKQPLESRKARPRAALAKLGDQRVSCTKKLRRPPFIDDRNGHFGFGCVDGNK